MPEISRFYGIVIKIFHADHAPPHFHVEYGEHKAKIDINRRMLFEGYLPPRALGMVIEWATLHQEELNEMWENAVKHQQLSRILPLP
ncbi:MAG: DUF4160 domain-containing protein [Ignavibacteriae bacterium]|nr:DUF4160 domain-containing protein [Ignavibacteriota bacterium]